MSSARPAKTASTTKKLAGLLQACSINSRCSSGVDSTSWWRKCSASGSVGQPPGSGSLGGIRYEVEHKERIESGSKLLGALNVIRHVVPQKELVPGFVEEFASELLSGVGEQSRYEGTLGGTQPNPQVVFDILDAKAAVLELTAAAAGTRIVATDRRHETP